MRCRRNPPTASEAWILAGGAHRATVFNHALNLNDHSPVRRDARHEILVIDNDTRLPAFKDALEQVYYGFRR